MISIIYHGLKLQNVKMDKLTVISGTLFLLADVFAIVSLAMPDWIITDVGGDYLLIIILAGLVNTVPT